MYAITSEHPNKNLIGYLSGPVIRALSKDPVTQHYAMGGQVKGGLTTHLARRYYPTYQRKKHKHRKGQVRAKKASSRKEGLAIMKQLMEFISNGTKPRNALAGAIVHHFRQNNHSLQAAEVPVYIQSIDKVTQADLITEDAEGRLWMWEVKSGYNRVQKQGFMMSPLQTVPNRDHEHWELQRHYTHVGLQEQGLALHKSHVLNVYLDKDKRVHVDQRPVAKWIKDLEK